jgi:hypothetical protein
MAIQRLIFVDLNASFFLLDPHTTFTELIGVFIEPSINRRLRGGAWVAHDAMDNGSPESDRAERGVVGAD